LTGLASLSSAEVTTVSSIVTTFVLSQGCGHKPMIHPCDNAWQEGGITFGMLQQFAARCRMVFCLILCEKPGNKFC
jgi:hypothetical protein